MTSAQHKLWIVRGKPMKVARPVKALGARLQSYGYTVYYLGDEGHLDHIPPEDHTPYSETGWPIKTPYGWVTALDIMPPTRPGLPSLQRLGGQIYDDRLAGVAGISWLKYMNWGPVDNRHAVHDQWEPNHRRSTSSDTGHIHGSSRSDMTESTIGDFYDPVARLLGQPQPKPPVQQEGDDEMFFIQYKDPAGKVWAPVFLTDTRIARWMSDAGEIADELTLDGENLINITNSTPRVVTRKTLIGRIVGPVPQGFEDLALNTGPVTSVATSGN